MKRLLSIFLIMVMTLMLVPSGMDRYAEAAGGNAVEARIEYCNVDNPYVRAKLIFDRLETNGVVYAGIYTSCGILRQVKELQLLKGSSDMIITFSEESIASNDSIRIFFFDKISGLKPLGKSLRQDFDTAHLTGVVTGTSIYGGDCDKNQAVFTINNANGYTDWEDKLDRYGYMDYTFYVADGIDIDSYFGVTSRITVEPHNNGYIITAIEEDGSCERLSFTADNLDFDETTDDCIVYYPDDDSTKSSTLKLENDLTVIVNYELIYGDSLCEVLDDLMWDYAEVNIEAIENTGDTRFDLIIIKAYKYAIVEEVEAERDRFTTVENTYTFDFEDEEVVNKIVNKYGEPITLADFKANDVVAIISEDGEHKDFRWIEVINLGQNTVKGVVTEVSDDGAYINGNKYNVFHDYICLGDEGTFYLTMSGNIFYYDLSPSVNGNYGYILETALNSTGFSDIWQVKLLTCGNGIVVYDVDDSVKVNGATYEGDYERIPVLSELADSDNHKDLAETRLITYKINSKGYIKEINSADTRDVWSEYNADAQVIDGFPLEDNTVVFDVSGAHMSSARTTDLKGLVDEAEYSGLVSININCEFDCFVILMGGRRIDAASDIAVVESTAPITTEDGSDAYEVSYYISGDPDVKKLVVVDDCEISEPLCNTTIEDIRCGSLMMFFDGGTGIASAYTVIANVDSDNTWGVNESVLHRLMEMDEDNEFVFGPVFKSQTVSSGEIITAFGEGEDMLLVNDSTHKYTVNLAGDDSNITVSRWNAGDVGNYSAADKTASFFFARLYEGNLTDIITIGNRADCNLGDEEPIIDPGEELEDVNYGYILETAINSAGFSDIWQIKLLTEDNGIVVYDVDYRFRVNSVMYEGDDENAGILSELEGSYDHKENAASRLVTYRLNGSGYIKEINSTDTRSVCGGYGADAQIIDKCLLEDDAVVFDVTNGTISRAHAADVKSLINHVEYTGIVSTRNGCTYECFVVLVGGSKINPATDIAVVESVWDITVDYEDAIKIRYYISNNSELKELTIYDDMYISEGYWNSNIDDIRKGSLIIFAENGEGVATAYAVLANVNYDNKWEVNEDALEGLICEDDDMYFVCGPMLDYTSKTAGKVISCFNDEMIVVKASTNKYTIDNTGRTWNIDVGDWAGGEVDRADDEGTTHFFAKLYNGVVSDFVTIGARADAYDPSEDVYWGDEPEEAWGDVEISSDAPENDWAILQ